MYLSSLFFLMEHVKYAPHPSDQCKLTGLYHDFLNELGHMHNTISALKNPDMVDLADMSGLKDVYIPISELPDLPYYDEIYDTPKKLLVSQKKYEENVACLNNIIRTFNTRPKSYTLNEVEEDEAQLMYAIRGEF